jgi:DNA-binding NtrC family response regulator
MKRILLVEANPSIRGRYREILSSHAYDVITHEQIDDAISALRERSPSLVIAGYDEPREQELRLVRTARESNRPIPVLVLTDRESTRGAIDFMDAGAYDYRPKPANPAELLGVVEEILRQSGEDRTMRKPVPAAPSETLPGPIIGSSPEMIEIFKLIGRIAKSDAAVLVLGESGTGKELVARTIHETSRRSGKPFLAVNCAAIPETLLESELFGHEKGAFTGAASSRKGKFELSQGGTIFLDEVGDMSLSTQAKILRVLQEHTYERVGGEETLRADARIIAATNKSLVELIERNEFRVDLFYRLKVVSIYLPPLRKRPGDLHLLADHFVRKHSAQSRVRIRGISERAMAYLEGHPWSGNVRELENAIQTGVVLNRTGILDFEDFPFLHEHSSSGAGLTEAKVLSKLREEAKRAAKMLLAAVVNGRDGTVYHACLQEVEQSIVEAGIEHCRGNQVQASRLLGISRNTLRTKIASSR